MIKVKEILTSENGFFKTLKEVQPTSYAAIFGDTSPEHLDISLSIKGGERFASPLIIERKLEDVVTYLIIENYSKWLKYKELLNLDYNVLNPYEQKKTTTLEKTGENNFTSIESDINKVHTFDSDKAIDKDTSTNEDTNTTTEKENIKTIVETSGNVGNVAPTKLIVEEMKLRTTQLNDLILKDIIKEISLDIY